MRTRQTLLIVLVSAAVLATTAPASAKVEPGTKHPAIDALPDIGPEAKRQANYILTEVIQFLVRVDKIMKSDDTTKAHMDNAYNRATQRSIDDWVKRHQKVMDAHAEWAKARGKSTKTLGDEWHEFSKMIGDFLKDLSEGRGVRSIRWKREINTAAKKFKKWTKSAPKAVKLYRSDVDFAEKKIIAAKATLDKSVAKLDDLKQHARHLAKARITIKNLQKHMVEYQKRGKDIFADKAWKPETFKKGFDAIKKWKSECDANDKLSPALKVCPTQWLKYAQKAYDEYKATYSGVKSATAAFIGGTIFDDSQFFRGLKYDNMVGVIDKMIEKVDARIKKIKS